MRIAEYTFGVGSDPAFSVPLALAVPSEITPLASLLSLGWYEAHVAGLSVGDEWWSAADGRMTSWVDLTGNGRALTNAVNTGPRMTASGSNTVARCNADSVVGRNAPEYGGQQKVTSICVVLATIGPLYCTGFSWSRFSWRSYHPSSTVVINLGPSVHGTVPVVPAVPHMLCARFDGTQPTNATRLRLRVNGADAAPTYVGTIPATLTVDVGTDICVGSTAMAGGYKFAGDIMAYCTVFRVLSDAEVLKAEAALRQLIGGLP